MLSSSSKQTTILPHLLLHLLQASGLLAYDPGTGSAVAGNLSTSAPWGIPPDKFESATKSPDALAAFNATGYNVSSSAPSPQSADGWVLAAGVKYDASLSDATGDVPTGDVYQATTLYVEAPSGMTLADSWRVCAVVWPGVAGASNASSSLDGTCRGVLSTSCIQALGVAGASGSSGMSETGECGGFALPEGCAGDFPSGTGNVTAVSINQTVLDAKRFYAYGSEPTSSKNNATSQDAALQNVWPVVMIYGHVSSGGQLSSSNAGVQCVRATNGTTSTDGLPAEESGATRHSGGTAVVYAALWAAGLIVGCVAMV